MSSASTPAGPRRGLTWPELFIVAGSSILLAFVALWPAFVPRDPARQIEFAWEMYAKMAPQQRFTVIEADGQFTIEPYEIAPVMVAEVPYEDLFPVWLCERFPNATAVEVEIGPESWTHRC